MAEADRGQDALEEPATPGRLDETTGLPHIRVDIADHRHGLVIRLSVRARSPANSLPGVGPQPFVGGQAAAEQESVAASVTLSR